MLIQPLIGALSDKIGRRTSMLCFGSLAAIFTVPILSIAKRFLALCRFWSVMCALLIVSFIHQSVED